MVTVVNTPAGRRLAADVASNARGAGAKTGGSKQTLNSNPRTATAPRRQTPTQTLRPAPARAATGTNPQNTETRSSILGILLGCAVLAVFAASVASIALMRGGLFRDRTIAQATHAVPNDAAEIKARTDERPQHVVSPDPVPPTSATPETPASPTRISPSKPSVSAVVPNEANGLDDSPETAAPGGVVAARTPASVAAPDTTVKSPSPNSPAPNAAPVAAGNARLTTQEIVKQCEPSVCRVHTQFGSLGTGFVVAPQIVATNEHVVGLADPSGITISFPSRGSDTEYRRVELAYAVPEVDLVLLRVQEMPQDIRPLEVARIADLEKGEPLLVIGNPGGLTNVVTQGLFGSVQSLNGAKYLQLSMSINRGNSGGPALTASGRVAGVVTLKSPQEGIGLAIPGDVLATAVQKIESAPKSEIDRNVTWWRARQTGTKLVVGCNISLDLIRLYATVAQRGGNARQAVQRAARRNEQLTTQVRSFADDLKDSMRSLASADVEDEDRRTLNQLSNAFQQLSRVAIQPPNSPNDLRNIGQWAQRVPQLEQHLRSRLGMMNTADHVELESD